MARRGLAFGLLGLAMAGVLSGCDLLEAGSDGGASSSGAADIDGEFLKTGGDGSNWASIGFNYDEARYSPLNQINTDNIAELGLAWSVDLPDARGQEATPVVVDGKIYISTAWSKVYSYDALTGEELWAFDPEVDKAVGVNACCDVVNRGVAVYQGKVFGAALDGRLIA